VVFPAVCYITCYEPKEPIIILHPSSIRSILLVILLSYLGLGLESGSFLRRSQTKVTRQFSFSTMHFTSQQSHSNLFLVTQKYTAKNK